MIQDNCTRTINNEIVPTSNINYFSGLSFMLIELLMMFLLIVQKLIEYQYSLSTSKLLRLLILVFLMTLCLCSNLIRIFIDIPINVACFTRIIFIMVQNHKFRNASYKYFRILNETKLMTMTIFVNILLFGCIARVIFQSNHLY